MILGFFFVRPIPLPHTGYSHISDHSTHEENDVFSAASPGTYRRDDSRTHLLGAHVDTESFRDEDDMSLEPQEPEPASEYIAATDDAVALSPSRPSSSRHRQRSSLESAHRSTSAMKRIDDLPNVRGSALASSKMFWLLFVITSLRM